MRKTLEVAEFRTYCNKLLSNSLDNMSKEREAIATVLEHVLIVTDNYSGFRFESLTDASRRYYY